MDDSASVVSSKATGVARVGSIFGLTNLLYHLWSTRGVWTQNYVLGSALIGLVLLVSVFLPSSVLVRALSRLRGLAQSRLSLVLSVAAGLGLTFLLARSPQLGVLFWIALGFLPLYLTLRKAAPDEASASTPAPLSPKRQLRRLQLGLGFHLVLWTVLLGLVALSAGAPLLFHAVLVFLLALASGQQGRKVSIIALNAGSLLFALVVGIELGLSAAVSVELAPARYPYPYRLHGYSPSQKPETNHFGATTESTGLRSPSEIPPKPKGEFRILVLGGSTMLGVGSPDESTPSAFLERTLNTHLRAHPVEGVDRIRVINAGQGWYITTQELVFLTTQLVLFEPDLLLAVDGYNDAHHAYAWNTKPSLNAISGWRYQTDQITNELTSRATWSKAGQTLAGASALRELSGIAPGALIQGDGGPSDPIAQIGTEGLEKEELRAMVEHRLIMNWTLMDAVARSCGARAAFALQPVIYLKEPLAPSEKRFLERPSTQTYSGRMTEEWRHLEERVSAGDLGLTVFSTEGHIRGSSEALFTDYCHLTPRGNELLAKSMHEAVLAELKGWPWKAHYRGVRYTSELGDPLWRVGPPMKSWVQGVPRDEAGPK